MSISLMAVRILPFDSGWVLLLAMVLNAGSAAAAQDAQPAGPGSITIQAQPWAVYPAVLTNVPGHLASPGVSEEGHEYLLVRTAAGHKAIVVVTVENGPLNLRYGMEKIGKGDQRKVDADDFPTLAATGLHAPAELEQARTITGKAVEEITRIGRPGMASSIGFLAEDEDLLSILIGDNERVARLGLKHPNLARPLFHVWNLLLREYALGKLGRFKDDVGSFWYGGREIHLRAERTKGFQESIFNDEVKGAFDIEIRRELDAEEQRLVRERYAHLSAADREALVQRLTRLRTGEMQPYYIMRYGFYEGHTEYRVDPIAIAMVFSLKPLAEIDQACDGQLDRVLTSHFQARPARR